MSKILIFYSKTGSGHLRAAEALKEELDSHKNKVEVILHEGLETGTFGIKTKASSFYALFSKELQSLYNLLYILTNNNTGTKLLRLLTRKALGRNLRNIIDKNKPDIIISVHSFLSRSTIKKTKHSPQFITIVTDLGYPHRIWFDESVDKIITPTESIASFGKRLIGGKNAKIVPIGYPLKRQFLNPRQTNKFTNTVLILGGGEGVGKLEAQVQILLKNLDKKIIAVCGKNEKLFKNLSKIEDSRLKVYGFTEMATLYDKADLVITKAGPGTIVESATLRRPLIITSWIGMQEKDNIDFVVQNNLGIYEPDIKKLPDAVRKIYENYGKYSSGESIFENGAKKIAEYILDEYGLNN